jgi:hypothetical protein
MAHQRSASSGAHRSAKRASQQPTARPARKRAPLASNAGAEQEASTSAGDGWELEGSAESYGAQQELKLLNSSKGLNVPPLKRRKFAPPIPREEPE